MEDAVKPTYPRIRICLHTYVCICVFPYSGTYAHDYPVAPTSSSPSSSSSLLRSLATVCRTDAQGLNIPIDRIAGQPDVQASGGMNAGTSTTATCSVWTGLESPWTLTWRWTADKGWKCTGINGPLEGAYTVLGDKAPAEDKDDEK